MCGLKHCWDFQLDTNLDELLLEQMLIFLLGCLILFNGVIMALTFLFLVELSGVGFLMLCQTPVHNAVKHDNQTQSSFHSDKTSM